MKQIYLDTDDEITAIIGKLESLSAETVALIPPKRSTVLQSVVNLKLLKKAAEANDVKLVLITRDGAILNMASQLKVLTAPNLETEPSVPEPATPLKELPPATIDGTQPSESDLSQADAATSQVKPATTPAASAKGLSKSKRVPDFDRFKKWALIGLAALIVIGGGIWALLNLLPGAEVAIQGRTQDTTADFQLRLVTGSAAESDIETATLAAESRQLTRTLTTTFPASGEDTVGESASGQVTVSNCQSSTGISIQQGTALTAANGLVFRATQTVFVPGGVFEPTCTAPGTATVPVQAAAIGPAYNIGPTSYTVEGYSSDTVSGQGGNMSGGSEETVAVVTAADIAAAQEELLGDEEEEVRRELARQFDDSHYIVTASFRSVVDSATAEPRAGGRAESGRLILQVTYTMLAVDQDEFERLLAAQHLLTVEDNAGLGTIATGLENAETTATDDQNVYGVRAEGVVGPDITVSELQEAIAGLRYQEAIDYIEAIPNVTRVQIDLSPLWASHLPQDADKIEITFDIDGLDADNSSD